MVVPVLMTNCQVSENPKTGPLIAHNATAAAAQLNAAGCPEALATACEALLNKLVSAIFCAIKTETARQMPNGLVAQWFRPRARYHAQFSQHLTRKPGR